MLQACLNGKRSKDEHARVPCSPQELAADARMVREAGADELHIHPRATDGAETLERETISECLAAVRNSVPGMPVGVSTGQWIQPRGLERLELIKSWDNLPDYASVNVVESDSAQTMDILLSKSIGIEAGLWTDDDAKRFVGMPQLGRCLRVLLEINETDPDEAVAEAGRIIETLKNAGIELPVLLHGADGTVWRLLEVAKRAGISARVGLEDGLTLPDGSPAPDNRSIVSAARQILDS